MSAHPSLFRLEDKVKRVLNIKVGFFLKKYFIAPVWVFCVYARLCTTHVECLQRPESKHRTPGVGVTQSCEPLMWCREVNPGVREEQTPMLATSRAISPSPRVNVYRAMMIHIWSPVIRKTEARLLGRKQHSELFCFSSRVKMGWREDSS